MNNNELVEAAAKVLGLPVRDLAVPPGAVWWDVPHLKHDSETLMFPGDGGYTLRELVPRGTTQRWEDRKWNPLKSVDDALMVADVLRSKGYSLDIDGDAPLWDTSIYWSGSSRANPGLPHSFHGAPNESLARSITETCIALAKQEGL